MQASLITQLLFPALIPVCEPQACSVSNRYLRATSSAWFYSLICMITLQTMSLHVKAEKLFSLSNNLITFFCFISSSSLQTGFLVLFLCGSFLKMTWSTMLQLKHKLICPGSWEVLFCNILLIAWQGMQDERTSGSRSTIKKLIVAQVLSENWKSQQSHPKCVFLFLKQQFRT